MLYQRSMNSPIKDVVSSKIYIIGCASVVNEISRGKNGSRIQIISLGIAGWRSSGKYNIYKRSLISVLMPK